MNQKLNVCLCNLKGTYLPVQIMQWCTCCRLQNIYFADHKGTLLLLMEEIRRSPVEVGSFSHHLQGFLHIIYIYISQVFGDGISSNQQQKSGSLPTISWSSLAPLSCTMMKSGNFCNCLGHCLVRKGVTFGCEMAIIGTQTQNT